MNDTRIRNVRPFRSVTAAGVTNQAWQAVAINLDEPVLDGRIIEAAGLDWREPPLTLMYQPETEEGHDGAYPVGRIDRIWKAGLAVMMEGVYLDTEEAQSVWQLVEDQTVRGVSVDLAVHKITLPQPEADPMVDGIPEGDITIDLSAEAPTINESTIIGLTVLPQQADTLANIINTVPGDVQPEPAPGVTASAAGLAPVEPPVQWFADPELSGPTALTVTDEGRVYGHIATWGVCHTGQQGRCLPPEKLSGYDSTYDYFHLGELVTAEGERIAVGTMAMDGPHADRYADLATAVATYDNTTTAMADIRLGNDEHGIWCAGAVRPDVDAMQLRRFRASKPSGDWRPMNGRFELCHVLNVNSPGYPVPRTIFSEDAAGNEEPLAVLASGFNPGLYPDIITETIHVTGQGERLTAARIKVLAARAKDGVQGLARLAGE